MERILPRRAFLKLLGVGAVELTAGGLLSKIAKAASLTEPEKKLVPIFSLEDYLRRLKLLWEQLEPIVWEHDLFVGFKGLSPEARMEDFQMYFPLYTAGELQYDIPWLLLWIIHVQETTVSREENGRDDFKGAMQRWTGHSDAQAAQAASGWEFLADLDQRWTKQKGYPTNDYEEILWAAEFIIKKALVRQEKTPSLSWEEAVLNAQYDYCADWVAEARIRQYRLFKTYFAPLDQKLAMLTTSRRDFFQQLVRIV